MRGARRPARGARGATRSRPKLSIGSATMSATRAARADSEPNGSWKTICICRRICAHPRRRQRGHVRAVEDHLALARLDQAQEQPAEGGLAAAGFADHAPASRRARPAKLTPSTARTTGGRRGPSRIAVSAKVLPRRSDVDERRSSRTPPPRRAQQAARWPGRAVRSGGISTAQRRSCSGQRGAERAAGPDRARRRHRARDLVEALVRSSVERRDRPQQPPGVGVARVEKSVPTSRILDDAAGVHDDDPLADLGDDAEIVGDEQDRRC